jgi:hypothetical protein
MFPIAISARSDAAQLTLHEITVLDSGREIPFTPESGTTTSLAGSLRLS